MSWGLYDRVLRSRCFLLIYGLLLKKTLFLMTLATAKRVGEFQVISFLVAVQEGDLFPAYLPEFSAKMETKSRPILKLFPLLC